LRIVFETLEDRTVPTVTLLGEVNGSAAGPSPLVNGQVENIPSTGPGADPVVGAIHSIATHPTDANIMFIGAVNGGVSARPMPPHSTRPDTADRPVHQHRHRHWPRPDRCDNNALVAGISRFSSSSGNGGLQPGFCDHRCGAPSKLWATDLTGQTSLVWPQVAHHPRKQHEWGHLSQYEHRREL
jgi:hypothetical protein